MLTWNDLRMSAWALGRLRVLDEDTQAKLEALRFSEHGVYKYTLIGVPLMLPMGISDFKMIDPTRFSPYPISFGQYYIDYYTPLSRCEVGHCDTYKVFYNEFEDNSQCYCPICNAIHHL